MNEESIFLEALTKDAPKDRALFLDQACGPDAELRRGVESLLLAHAQAGNFLKVDPPLDEKGECPGTLIGPYKLLELIGEGGMGLVYVAEQQRPVHRRVALKLIKPGMDSRQVIARFEAERQALAMMDHPNIAKILDAGTVSGVRGQESGVSKESGGSILTPDPCLLTPGFGRPYFVMELVKGLPITDYCDKSRLRTRQRLELFLDVCHAVQHAHQKGIIHRDLKPSNILVEVHDVRPVVKIIDFGISKAIGQQLTEKTLYTGMAHMVGTPMYMSPEQAGLSSLDVDTRSDVYSLGVLLYELLTGTTPFESEALKKAGYDEMRRIIREEEPPKPSTRLSTLQGAALATKAERRGLEPRGLTLEVQAELDWMAMRAIEKDRNRRYESVSALAADVERYLSDEPVEACPPSAVYRMRKFACRNKVALATTGLVATALLIGASFSVWQAIEATAARQLADNRLENEKQARHDAEADRKKAEAAERKANIDAAIARAVSDFLQEDLLRQVDSDPRFPDEFSGNMNLTVKEALDRAAAKISERFQDQPLVEAAIRMAIGEAYRSLFENKLAGSHFEKAVELRRASLGPNHPDTLASMHRLADMYSWVGRHVDAITLCQQLLDNQQAQFGPDDPKTLKCASHLAKAYHNAGQWDVGVRLLEPVLEKQRVICGPTHPDTLGTMHQLAHTCGFQNRFAESMALHEKLFKALESTNDPLQKPIWPMVTFACVCQRAGKFDKADQLFREILDQQRKRDNDSLGKRNDIANALGFLAVNELLQDHYKAAETLAREALAQKQMETHRPFYWMSVLGAALMGQHKYADAEPLLLQGYQGMKQLEPLLFANDKLRLANAGEWITRFYEVTNQPDKARIWREKVKPSKNAFEK